jgi:hypothetical protein
MVCAERKNGDSGGIAQRFGRVGINSCTIKSRNTQKNASVTVISSDASSLSFN